MPMTLFVAFVLGLVVGSVLSATALILAMGTTSRDTPKFAIREGYRNEDGSLTEKGKRFSDRRFSVPISYPPPTLPNCQVCGREADVVEKRWSDNQPLGWGCSEHGLIRPDPTRPEAGVSVARRAP